MSWSHGIGAAVTCTICKEDFYPGIENESIFCRSEGDDCEFWTLCRQEAEELFGLNFLSQVSEETILSICTDCVREYKEANEFSLALWEEIHLYYCIEDYPRGLRGQE